jgi:hypothetical protein
MRVRLEHQAMVLLAGGIAERRFTGRANHVGAMSDYEKAADFAMACSGSERATSAFLKWLETVTEDVVRDRWAAIEAVAAALFERKTLSGKDVDRLVVEALTGRHPAP